MITMTAPVDLTGTLVRYDRHDRPARPIVGVVIATNHDRLGVFPDTHTVRPVGASPLHTFEVPVGRVTPIELPEMTGDVYGAGTPHEFDGRARFYTVEHLPFDAMPARGGPYLAGLDRWAVSYSQSHRTGMWTLSVVRLEGRDVKIVRHELCDTTWPTGSDAQEAAYNAGVVGFMVYEKDAARWNLPTVVSSVA